MTATATNAKASARIFRRSNLLWLAVYAIAMTGVVWGMLQLRRATLRTMDTPQARADWQAWRDAPPNQRDDLPVKRRPPSSNEPPSLILMRDHFPVMMSAAVVFGSLLFAAITILTRGALSHDASGKNQRPPDSPGKAVR
jgi:hypothetical protein